MKRRLPSQLRRRRLEEPRSTAAAVLHTTAVALVLLGCLTASAVYLADVYEVGVSNTKEMFLTTADLPASLGLIMTTKRSGHVLNDRRRKEWPHQATPGGKCGGYGVQDDPYFPRFGGHSCGLARWENTDMAERPEQSIRRLEIVYKLFDSEHDAAEYYRRFWGIHMYDPAPYYMLKDVTATSVPVGDDHHALMWDPRLVQVPIEDPTMTAKHVVYITRIGNALVKLYASGFQQYQFAYELTPDLLSRLAAKIEVRMASQATTREGRLVRAGVDRLKAVLHRAHKAVRWGLRAGGARTLQGARRAATACVTTTATALGRVYGMFDSAVSFSSVSFSAAWSARRAARTVVADVGREDDLRGEGEYSDGDGDATPASTPHRAAAVANRSAWHEQAMAAGAPEDDLTGVPVSLSCDEVSDTRMGLGQYLEVFVDRLFLRPPTAACPSQLQSNDVFTSLALLLSVLALLAGTSILEPLAASRADKAAAGDAVAS